MTIVGVIVGAVAILSAIFAGLWYYARKFISAQNAEERSIALEEAREAQVRAAEKKDADEAAVVRTSGGAGDFLRRSFPGRK